MSVTPTERELPPIRPYHYQVLCGAALGILFFLQLEHGLVLVASAVLLLGGSAVLLRVRVSPILVIVPVVGGELFQQYAFALRRPHVEFAVEDVLLCAAAMAYVAGHYRLLSIWSYVLPRDPRQRYHARAQGEVPATRIGAVVPQPRPAVLLSRGELAWFVMQLPLFALAAQAAWLVLGGRRDLHDLPLRWVQLLQVAWGLGLVLFVVGQFFRFWRFLQIDPITARLFLQETLWHETRGEQRRIGRWLAWARLRVRASASRDRSAGGR